MERTAVLGRLTWQVGQVVEIKTETPHVTSLLLELPEWPGHRAGQHVDIRLTAEDGHQAVRSYSIASPPEEQRIEVTIERLEDGEVSPYLVDEVRVGDQLELRGPIGGYFVWDVALCGLLFLVGGLGVVPLMAMIRHRVAIASDVPIRLLYSARSADYVIYRTELEELASRSTPTPDPSHRAGRATAGGSMGLCCRRSRRREWSIPSSSSAARRRWRKE